MLSAILLLGNVTYAPSEDTEGLRVGPPEVVATLSDLLKVRWSSESRPVKHFCVLWVYPPQSISGFVQVQQSPELRMKLH